VDDQSYLPVVPNLDLRPEESASYEVGVRATVPLTSRFTAQADAAVFWNDYDGLVEPTFIPQEQAFQFINLTEARIRGMEASAEAASQDDRWRLGISYTLLDAKDLTTDQALGFRSRHLLKTFLSVPLYGPLSAGIDYRYASAPDRVDSDFARFVRDAQVIGPTHVVDARLGARWRHWGLALIAKNALDYYYVERPAILAPPRHFIVQLRTQF
jgi:iron complex outermembrane receptor protein